MKNGKIILVLVIAAAAVFAIVMIKKNVAKKNAANIIHNFNTALDLSTLMSFGIDYLTAWSNAIQAKQDYFVLNSIGYDVSSGTALGSTGD